MTKADQIQIRPRNVARGRKLSLTTKDTNSRQMQVVESLKIVLKMSNPNDAESGRILAKKLALDPMREFVNKEFAF